MKFKLEFDQKSLDWIKQSPEKFKEGLLEGAKKVGFFLEKEVKESFGEPGKPQVRKGYLRRSIRNRVEEHGREIVIKVGSNLIYAPVQELGAVIRAKKAEYLTFKIDGQWRRKKEVTIPARPYIRPTVEENLTGVEKFLVDAVLEKMMK